MKERIKFDKKESPGEIFDDKKNKCIRLGVNVQDQDIELINIFQEEVRIPKDMRSGKIFTGKYEFVSDNNHVKEILFFYK